ncbi:MAG TPA: hypothetical protein VMV48_01940 [Gallionellaceae bacterium]|nr:hypothetical protein [Gallionellaceae bacterium]
MQSGFKNDEQHTDAENQQHSDAYPGEGLYGHINEFKAYQELQYAITNASYDDVPVLVYQPVDTADQVAEIRTFLDLFRQYHLDGHGVPHPLPLMWGMIGMELTCNAREYWALIAP